jgi:hypothetical protein
MRKKEFAALGRQLINYLPGFVIAKTGKLVMSPVTHTLRGVSLYGSIAPRDFYAHVFFQPLFLPAEHVALNLGWRIGGASWHADEIGVVEQLGALLAREAVPFLSRIDTVDDMIAVIRELRFGTSGYGREALAYCLAKAGHYPEAIDDLNWVAAVANRAIEWQRVAAERAELLAETLRTDPAKAQAMLTRWETESATRLNVAAYRLRTHDH